MGTMRATVGRLNAMTALAAPQACAMPDGTATNGYRITSDLLALLLRHGMIQESDLTPKARAKHRIIFVYTITDRGMDWLDQPIKA